MLRLAFFFTLSIGFLALTAYRTGGPQVNERAFLYNTTLEAALDATVLFPLDVASDNDGPEIDSIWSAAPRILMLNYSAYDSAYSNKIHRTIQHKFPAATMTDFWDGSADDLSTTLLNHDAVVIAYPYNGVTETLTAYSKVLNQFIRQGGLVVLTGTHEYGMLQQYGLFDLDFGYYCSEPKIHQSLPDHPMLTGLPADFPLCDYAYPLDVSDPAFQTLADVNGYPVIGYKALGMGKVVYLGLEFYYDQPETSLLLANVLRWGIPNMKRTAVVADASRRMVKRTVEVLHAGNRTARTATIFELKIYPNPYISKATLDIDLSKTAMVGVEMTDEIGRVVATLLPNKNLNAGLYQLELPNLAPGVYFVQCRMDDEVTVRKVVKSAAR